MLKEIRKRCVMWHRNTTSRCLLYTLLFHIVVMGMLVCFFRWEVLGSSKMQASEDTQSVQLDGVTYHFPATLLTKSLDYYQPLENPDVSHTEALNAYHHYMNTMHVECRERARLGSARAGYDVCLAAPYKPSHECLVYSFGVNNKDWTFVDDLSSEFKCHIRAFDPFNGEEEHDRSDLVHFFPVGLDAEERHVDMDGGRATLSTLARLLKQIGDSDKIIDFVKIDIGDTVWSSMNRILVENSLRNVKQLAIQLHTNSNTTAKTYGKYLKVLYDLEDQGFKKWNVHLNDRCLFYSEDLRSYFSHCQELNYINLNFLR